MAHRQGRIRWLSALGDFSARVSGFPAWYALPAAVAGISLLVAVTGFYWDVATHIDNGRDPGPFGNAAHFPILIGLLKPFIISVPNFINAGTACRRCHAGGG